MKARLNIQQEPTSFNNSVISITGNGHEGVPITFKLKDSHNFCTIIISERSMCETEDEDNTFEQNELAFIANHVNEIQESLSNSFSEPKNEGDIYKLNFSVHIYLIDLVDEHFDNVFE